MCLAVCRFSCVQKNESCILSSLIYLHENMRLGCSIRCVRYFRANLKMRRRPRGGSWKENNRPSSGFSVSHGINFRSHRRCFDECTWTRRIQYASKARANSVSYPIAKSATSVRFSEATFVRRGKCERGSFGRTSRKPSSSGSSCVYKPRTRHRIFVIRRKKIALPREAAKGND